MTILLSAINRVAFSIGSVDVAWYGILIVCGMLTSLVIAMTQCKRIGLTTDDIIEFFLWVIPIAVVMGRLMYVVSHPDDFFDPILWKEDSTQAFVDVIALWDGGITILGGILGGFFGVVFFSIRKRKVINFGQALDLIVPVLLIGQLFGRVGNFINQEAFGLPASMLGIPEKFPFAVFIDQPSGVAPEFRDIVYSNLNTVGPNGEIGGWFAATFFYEMCWNAVGATIAFIIWRKNSKSNRYPGILAFFYFFWYFLGRALLEYLRIDAVAVTQTLCFVVAPIAVVLGVLYILFRENRIAFKKVNEASQNGTASELVLSKWEVDNYNFTAKMFQKPNKFLSWLYGVSEFVPAEEVKVASKEALEEYRKQQKEQNKVLLAEEKQARKEEWAKKVQNVKDFFGRKENKEENITTDTEDVQVESGENSTDETEAVDTPDTTENNESSDAVTGSEIKDEE